MKLAARKGTGHTTLHVDGLELLSSPYSWDCIPGFNARVLKVIAAVPCYIARVLIFYLRLFQSVLGKILSIILLIKVE